MLTENEIIKKMVSFFEKKGFSICETHSTNEHGIDIIAKSPKGIPYYIEAKGETSSKSNTKRFGKSFNKNQVRTHISVAMTKCFQTLQKSPDNCVVGIALPKDENHFSIIKSIEKPLRKTELKIYLVNKDGTVEEYI
jgi:Restriction endonuclease